MIIPNRRHRRAFTLIELLVVVAIIALMISILLPSLARAKKETRRVICQSNLRVIGQGVGFYLNDSNGVLPTARMYGVGGYQRLQDYYHAPLGTMIANNKRPLNRYFKDIDVFECPSDGGDPVTGANKFFEAHGTSYSYASHSKLNGTPLPDGTTVEDEIPSPWQMPPSYGIQSCRRHPTDPNRDGLPMGFVKHPVRKIVFLEPPLSPALADPSLLATGYPEDKPAYRDVYRASSKAHWHDPTRQHANVLFGDFHVAFTLFNEEKINASVLGSGRAPWDPGDQSRRYY